MNNKKYDLVICTTAVSRPDLHSIIFPRYIKALEGLSCKWIINIDKIEIATPIETEKNLIDILQVPNIDVEIIKQESGGSRKSFYNSAKRVINKSVEYNPKYGFMWLEDDWNFYGNKPILEILTDFPLDPYDYMQLVNRNIEVSFNPGLWSRELWHDVAFNKINSNNPFLDFNPERACCYPIQEVNTMVKNHKYQPCFADAGRDWASKLGIFRTFTNNRDMHNG
jgi:hypothetical protein